MIFKLVAKLIASRNLETNLEVHALGFSRDEVLDGLLLFFHKVDWLVGALNQFAYLRVSKNSTQDKRSLATIRMICSQPIGHAECRLGINRVRIASIEYIVKWKSAGCLFFLDASPAVPKSAAISY